MRITGKSTAKRSARSTDHRGPHHSGRNSARRLPFDLINTTMTKKEIRKLIAQAYRKCGIKQSVIFADQLKNLGYKYATQAGISICIKDMVIRSARPKSAALPGEVSQVDEQYQEGLITEGEKYNKVVDIWAKATDEIAAEMMAEMAGKSSSGKSRRTKVRLKTRAAPGRGGLLQPGFHDGRLRRPGQQGPDAPVGGMRGLMAKPSGEIIETPITANFREGLTVLHTSSRLTAPGKVWRIRP